MTNRDNGSLARQRPYNGGVADRRSVVSGTLAAAALLPAVLWLAPALFQHRAPSLRDQGDFFYPLKLYTADRLAAGEIPFWNPLSSLGEPWLANGQSGVFYPPTWLFLLPFPALAAGLFLLLHFGLGAWGSWRFAKHEAVSDAGALFSAAAFSACGFSASISSYWNHFGAWAYLPAIAWLARTDLSRRSRQAELALLFGLQAMAGSPELSVATLLLAALLAWEARREPSGWAEASPGRRLARLAAAAGLGLALAGWVILPIGELLWQSERRGPLPAAERNIGTVESPALSSALGFSGEATANSYLPILYTGPLLLFASSAAFAEKQKRRLVLLLLLIGAAGILVSVSGPPGSWIRALPGLDRLRYPAKGLSWTFFAVAMIAGIGADHLRFLPSKKILLLVAAVADAVLLALSRQSPSVRLAEAAGICLLLLLALGAGRGEFAARTGGVLEAGAALALTASLAFSGRGLFRFVPEAEIRRVPESVLSLKRVPGRILTPPTTDLARWALKDASFDAATLRRQREALLGYTNLLAGVSTVRTAAPLATAAARRIADGVDSAQDLSRAAGPANARVLWMPFQPARMGSKKIGEFFFVPLNPYRPRLSFVTGYRRESDPARAWTRVVGGDIDWSREVLLDREPDPRPIAGGKRSFVIARIAEEHPERLAADVTSGSAGILVLADLWYPGWSVEVDGRPAPLLRADGCLRAIALPAGAHRAVFRYRPWSFYGGAAVSLVAMATILLRGFRGRP